MAANSLRTGLILELGTGMLSFIVSLHSAVRADSSELHGVCSGVPASQHAPSFIRARAYCPVCNISHATHHAFPRGRQEGDGIVVIPQDVLNAASSEGATFSRKIGVTVHDAAELAAAFPTGKAYYLASENAGAYRTLVAIMQARPDLGLVGRFAFMKTSAASFYQLVTTDGVLILRQLAFPSAVLAPPKIVDVGVDDETVRVTTSFLEAVRTRFDPAAVVDGKRATIAAYVAEATPVPMAEVAAVGDTTTAATAGGDWKAKAEAALRALTAVPDLPAKPKPRARTKKATTPAAKAS